MNWAFTAGAVLEDLDCNSLNQKSKVKKSNITVHSKVKILLLPLSKTHLHFATCMVVCLGGSHFLALLYSRSPAAKISYATIKSGHVPSPSIPQIIIES